MIQHLHDLYLAKNFLQIILIELTFVNDFDGNLVGRKTRVMLETEAIDETENKIPHKAYHCFIGS